MALPARDPDEVLSRIRADGRYPAVVPLALCAQRLSDFPWIAPAVATLVDTGELDRRVVVETCLTALDSLGRATDQKVVAEVLRLLDVRGDDVPGGLPRLQQVLATCHGFVTSRLLPLAVELLRSPADVAELATTITARPEKRQRADLVRQLTTAAVREHAGDQAVIGGLAILAEGADDEVSARARQAITDIGGAAPSEPVAASYGLWQRTPDVRPLPPRDPFVELSEFAARAVEMVRVAASQRLHHDLPPSHEPMALSVLVRWSHVSGPDPVRRAVMAPGPLPAHPGTPLGRVVPDWLDGAVPSASEAGPIPFPDRLARESLLRAGRVPSLLSTCTRPGATLDLEVLVERLRAAQSTSGSVRSTCSRPCCGWSPCLPTGWASSRGWSWRCGPTAIPRSALREAGTGSSWSDTGFATAGSRRSRSASTRGAPPCRRPPGPPSSRRFPRSRQPSSASSGGWRL